MFVVAVEKEKGCMLQTEACHSLQGQDTVHEIGAALQWSPQGGSMNTFPVIDQ